MVAAPIIIVMGIIIAAFVFFPDGTKKFVDRVKTKVKEVGDKDG